MTTLSISVYPGAQLSSADQAEILTLCSLAYEEDAAPWLTTLKGPIHVVGRIGSRIVSHAAWVERWLAPGDLGMLRAAYVEAVATLPAFQGRGYGAEVMQTLPPLIEDFDIAALSPSNAGFYRRIGWESWQGELSVRLAFGLIMSLDEQAMILRLPRTPAALDVTAPLSIDGRNGERW